MCAKKVRYKNCNRQIMKKQREENITTMLGLTQEKIALLIGVSRAQWSMYDGGGRRLPVEALEKLAELLALAKSSDTTKLSNARQAQEKKQHQGTLQKMLLENSYQQEKLSLKIEATAKKYHSNLRALHWLQQGVAKEKKAPGDDPSLLHIYHGQATDSLEKNSWSQIEQYRFRLKVLKEEERLLREEMS